MILRRFFTFELNLDKESRTPILKAETELHNCAGTFPAPLFFQKMMTQKSNA